MRLSEVKINYFRGIACADLGLHRDITVLIGENNTGKIRPLVALQLCLNGIKSDRACNFTEFGFYRDDTYQNYDACLGPGVGQPYEMKERNGKRAKHTEDSIARGNQKA